MVVCWQIALAIQTKVQIGQSHLFQTITASSNWKQRRKEIRKFAGFYTVAMGKMFMSRPTNSFPMQFGCLQKIVNENHVNANLATVQKGKAVSFETHKRMLLKLHKVLKHKCLHRPYQLPTTSHKANLFSSENNMHHKQNACPASQSLQDPFVE